MKKTITVIKNIVMVIGIALVLLIIIGVLVDRGVLKSEEDKSKVSIEYTPQSLGNQINESEIEDSHYFSSLEEALAADNAKGEEQQYQNHIDEIIKRFESDKYVTIYFKAKKDESTECITMAKFIKKTINEIEKYAFLYSIPTEVKVGGKTIGSLENLIQGQLALSDYLQNMNVNPENTRFVFGDCESKEVYKMKVEGQEPSGIIQYDTCQGKRYFWYYENLESTVIGEKLQLTLH